MAILSYNRVTCCCGGFSVKTGTEILLWISTVISGYQCFLLYTIGGLMNFLTIWFLTCTIIGVLGLYGLSENNPVLLKPYYILRIISFIYITLIAVAVIFAGAYVAELASESVNAIKTHVVTSQNDQQISLAENSVASIAVVVEKFIYILVICIVATMFLEYQFIAIIRSCIKLMEASAQGTNGIVLSQSKIGRDQWSPTPPFITA